MRKPLFLLLLASCLRPEQGIDDTVLVGTVQVPPGAAVADPGDGRDAPRDTLDDALVLDDLTWRWQPVDGSIRTFAETTNPDTGDENDRDRDWFVFTPAAAGSFTLVLAYETPVTDTGDTGEDSGGDSADSGDTADTGDTGDSAEEPTGCAFDESLDAQGSSDNLAFRVMVIDLAAEDDPACAEPLVNTPTDGAAGRLELELELVAGHDYAVRVSGLRNSDRLSADYRLWLSGSSPAEGDIKIGAFQPFTDIYQRGAPVGGAEVYDWTLDVDTQTWTGIYAIRKLRTVETAVVPNDYCDIDPASADCSEIEETTVQEGVATVALIAGDFANLNQVLPAGTLYNSVVVEETLTPDVENTAGAVVVLDAVAPKIIGWTFAESEPNDVFVDLNNDAEFYPLDIANIDPANEVPVASGVGFVDIINATQSFTVADPEWNAGDYDVFAFTVAEPLGAAFLTDWADDGVNLDVHLYDGAGELLAVGWSPADVKPELFDTDSWEVSLEPGQTYYLVVMGWSGAIGEYPYSIEIEWLSP